LSTNKFQYRKIIFFIVLSSFILLQAFSFFAPTTFENWNFQALDWLFKFRSISERIQPTYDETIVHIDLNDTTIRLLKKFYLNRSDHAMLIKSLSSANASAVLYDFIFAAPSSEKEDIALISETSKAGNVYFGAAFQLKEGRGKTVNRRSDKDENEYIDKTKWSLFVSKDPKHFYIAENPISTFSRLANASAGLGFLNMTPDSDGVFRRIPLIVRYKDAFYPSFSFRAVCKYLGVTPEDIIVEPTKRIILKNSKRPAENNHSNIVIPIDRNGNMIVNYIGPWGRMRHYHFIDVMHASDNIEDFELWEEELSGKIVIVSEIATGSSDVGPVPTDNNFPLSGVHSNAIHTILTGSFLKEISYIEVAIINLILMMFMWLIAIRFSSYYLVTISIALVILYAVVWAIAFINLGNILYISQPVFMIGCSLIMILVYQYLYEEKEKSFLRKSFEAYFPPNIVKKIVSNPKSLSLSGKKKEVSILFSDIKDFTKHTSTVEPDQVRKILNDYFESMTTITFKYGGTVDKFIGDGMMVFFGDPDTQIDHALRCVKASIEMQKEVRRKSKVWENQYEIPIHIRIGINTGVVFVGNMGSSMRLSYTAIGSDVNLAQRIESNAPVGGILISQKTYEMVNNKIDTEPYGKIKMKGFDERIIVYRVII
jgi:adenylate cyclase